MKKSRPVSPERKFASEDEDYDLARLIAEICLAIPRDRLIDAWLTKDERVVVENTTNPDHLSDDALRLFCVLTKDLGKSEFEPAVVPSALCDLIGDRRTKNATAELEAVDPEALAFSKHGIFALKVYADALNERRGNSPNVMA